jgi:transcriptional regulator with XRE-family HTH domain
MGAGAASSAGAVNAGRKRRGADGVPVSGTPGGRAGRAADGIRPGASDAPPNGSGGGDGDLGSRIRSYRRMRKLTLRQVAGHAGVTESFLSQVERGTSGASVATLRLVAEALGLRVADLFDEVAASGVRVLRADDRPTIHLPGVVKYMLTRRPLQNLEVLEGTLDPGASTGSRTYTHGDSQELLYVIAGDVVLLLLGDEEHRLGVSDCIEYRSSVSHTLTNVGAIPARVFWIISPPSL